MRREIRAFLTSLSGRHAGIRDSIAAALGNVNPYTLFDVALSKDGGDVSPSAVSQDPRIPASAPPS